ncbi:MAG TPA: Hsp20/alpha crystallin family protein [Opitutaceae bacterium]|nr:Hsp20/alpha crystallin family protein [Opitutaceae bacterium]
MSLFNALIPSFSSSPARRHGAAGESGPAVKPAYEVRETEEAYGLTVYLPGVARDGLELTADAGTLTITGRRGWKQPEGWTALYRESADAPFELVLEHDNAIDAEKIHAELADGVLRVSLPKAEAVKPRKIAVS